MRVFNGVQYCTYAIPLVLYPTVLVPPLTGEVCVYLKKRRSALKEKAMSDRLPVPSPSEQLTLLVADDADVIRRTLRNFLNGSLL